MILDPFSKKLLCGAGENNFISLMYHSIDSGSSKPAWEWAVSLQNFRNQMDLLEDYGWSTICSSQLNQLHIALPQKTVLITFDDGYADNELAFQELLKRKMRASWFIVTADIGKPSSWADAGAPSYPLLSTTQLREMSAAGMEIGSHTFSHPRLTQLPKKKIEDELSISKSALSDLLDRPINSFAYPYGLYNAEIRDMADSLAYQYAFTTRTGFGLVDNDYLQIRRISIMAGDSLNTFARKLAFADNNVSWSKIGSYSIKRLKSRFSA